MIYQFRIINITINNRICANAADKKPSIYLETKINSTLETCFDLARSIDLRQIQAVRSKEKQSTERLQG
jgi:hypothetical protein